MSAKNKGLGGPVPMEKSNKPSLHISANVNSYMDTDNKYDEKRKKDLKNEIGVIEKHLSNWDSEKVASHAKADLEHQLIMKKNEMEALCGKKKMSMM